MKRSGRTIILFQLLAVFACGHAAAHQSSRHWHGHARTHIGVVVGGQVIPPVYFRSPTYYAYPPIVTMPAPPPVYIEQHGAAQDIDEQPTYWYYYCQVPQGYYPYVQRCPQGWKRISPQPPDLQQP